jgi:cytochrome P450
MQPGAAVEPSATSFALELAGDPYPLYASLREAGPVVWSDDARGGAWLLSRYADITAALQDQRLSSARADAFLEAYDPLERQRLAQIAAVLGRWLLLMDAPRHSRLRKALNHGFKPAVIEALRPAVGQLVDELLAPLLAPDTGPGAARPARVFDFIRDFAYPLPARVIALMLGVPEADHSRFVAWSDQVVAFIGSLDADVDGALRAQEALLAITGYFRELLEHRDAVHDEDERTDLTALLLAARRRGEMATDEELLAQCSMFFFAGHETTRNLLGNGLHALLTHPDQAALLRADPCLMPRALRELARYDSPIQFTGRRALEDLTLHGRTIRRGDQVLLMIGSGNRDPERFRDPDRLDLTRDEGPPLSFGYGPHVCIGTTLSYLEAGLAFSRLFAATRGIRCIESNPQWVDNPAFRGLRQLRLEAVGGHGTTQIAAASGFVDTGIRAGAREGSGFRASGPAR